TPAPPRAPAHEAPLPHHAARPQDSLHGAGILPTPATPLNVYNFADIEKKLKKDRSRAGFSGPDYHWWF
ncbi:MAG: hypothetical protein LC808_35995, partial [Actinobacteria bacterium]|nr:hypothetical protein [Actinomycetota bacterium]